VTRRPIEYEINDLAVHLESVGMTEAQARKEAERIRDSIGAHFYAKGFADGQRSGSPVESLNDLIDMGEC
jgi:hypothetical protein